MESSIEGDGLTTGASLILFGATVSSAKEHNSLNKLTESLILKNLGIVLDISKKRAEDLAAECSLKM